MRRAAWLVVFALGVARSTATTSTRRDRFLQEVRDGVVGVTLHEPRDRARDMATVDLDEVDKD